MKKADLKKDLKKIVTGDVLDSPMILDKFSTDASIFKITPQVVVQPKNVSDIQKLVGFVNEQKDQKLSLTARTAGTDMTGGPLNRSIILDFTKYFNKVKEVGHGHAITEPGVYYRDFERQTLRKGLFLPSYPASRELCAIGGMVSNNSGGEKTLAYGKTEKYVAEMKMVLRDGNEYVFEPLNHKQLKQKMALQNFEGEIYRKMFELVSNNIDLIEKERPTVSKNSAGYAIWNVWKNEVFDLTKIFVGAQGTLGIMTEVKLNLIHPKHYSKLLVIFVDDLKVLSLVNNKLLALKPESLEFFDYYTLKLGARFFFWKYFWQFIPEAFLALQKMSLPKMVMLAEFTGDTKEEVEIKVHEARCIISRFNLPTRITSAGKDTEKYWQIRRDSFSLLRQRVKDKKTIPFIDDLIVAPDKLPEFLPALEKILKPYKKMLDYTIVGHVGDGNLHIIPLGKLEDQKTREAIPKVAREVYKLIGEYGGSITAEHNDGLIRTPYLNHMFSAKMIKIFEEVKKIFDPDNIFNPGKKVGMTEKKAFGFLKKE